LLFERAHAADNLFVAMNLGAEPVTLPIPEQTPMLRPILCPSPQDGRVEQRELNLPGFAEIHADIINYTRT
jgi:hypothetical protein